MCIADQRPKFTKDPHTLTGTLFRVPSCEILYGPLNCDFVLTGENWSAPYPETCLCPCCWVLRCTQVTARHR